MIQTSSLNPILFLRVPLPPSDNNLVRLARLGAYPTTDYREWLRVCAPILDDAIASTPLEELKTREFLRSVNREPWYEVYTELALPGGRRDGANYEKALFDLLSGKRLEQPSKKSSKLVMGPGLWPDDSLIRAHTTTVVSRREPEPNAIVSVYLTRPPYDDATGGRFRPRCLRAIEQVVAGKARKCISPNCGKRLSSAGQCTVIPATSGSVATICRRCTATMLSRPWVTEHMVAEFPCLHWEYAYLGVDDSPYGPLATRYTDLIWEEL